jgi:hypothetical protein
VDVFRGRIGVGQLFSYDVTIQLIAFMFEMKRCGVFVDEEDALSGLATHGASEGEV